MPAWERMMSAWGAASKAWSDYGKTATRSRDEQAARLALLGSFYVGSWIADPRWPWHMVPTAVYKNARLIVKNTGAVVDLYDQLCYSGDLSSDGDILPDGSRGAIPIDAQTGSDASDDQLRVAFAQLWNMWQWRSLMSLPVKTAAIFGDCLVEVIDEFERGRMSPNIVYPGYIPDADLDLDYAGNVRRYALEYPVKVEQSTAFGRKIEAESYLYRKEVDSETIRYYKDGKPFSYPDIGPEVQINPYGFTPAVLFRHEIVVGAKRGMGAYERSVTQAIELNSTLSAATDYQRKQFGMPVGVKGKTTLGPPGRTIVLGGTKLTIESNADEVDAARDAAGDEVPMIGMDANGEFVTVQFDVGKTMEMVEFTYGKIVSENPEAEWADKLLSLKEATGPGAMRQILPIAGKVEAVRRNHDPRMVQLAQMGTSMLAYRLKAGDIPGDILRARSERYEAFAPYDLDSFNRGLLDATIPGRPVFPVSELETATWLVLANSLTEPWALKRMGITDEELEEAEAVKQERLRQMESDLTGIQRAEERGAPAGPTGATGATASRGATGRTAA